MVIIIIIIMVSLTRYAQAAGSIDGAKDRLLKMVDLFKPLVADLISLPMPTIAAITGHAAAAGLMLAMSHDYVTMRSDKGVLYMSELDLGMTLPDYFTALIRSKMNSVSSRRGLVLRALKVKPEVAVEMGIVDSIHGSAEEAMQAASCLAEELSMKKWDGKAYAELRKALYPEVCRIVGLKDEKVLPSRL